MINYWWNFSAIFNTATIRMHVIYTRQTPMFGVSVGGWVGGGGWKKLELQFGGVERKQKVLVISGGVGPSCPLFLFSWGCDPQ